jgi:hypothetical protein
MERTLFAPFIPRVFWAGLRLLSRPPFIARAFL